MKNLSVNCRELPAPKQRSERYLTKVGLAGIVDLGLGQTSPSQSLKGILFSNDGVWVLSLVFLDGIDLKFHTVRTSATSSAINSTHIIISTVGSSSATRSSGSPQRGEKTGISLNSLPTGYRGRIRSETSSSNSTQLGLPRSIATQPALDPNRWSKPDSGIR